MSKTQASKNPLMDKFHDNFMIVKIGHLFYHFSMDEFEKWFETVLIENKIDLTSKYIHLISREYQEDICTYYVDFNTEISTIFDIIRKLVLNNGLTYSGKYFKYLSNSKLLSNKILIAKINLN